MPAAEQEDLEGVDPNDELYATAPTRPRRLISFDWAAGFVSPFRSTDDERADEIMARVGKLLVARRGAPVDHDPDPPPAGEMFDVAGRLTTAEWC